MSFWNMIRHIVYAIFREKTAQILKKERKHEI